MEGVWSYILGLDAWFGYTGQWGFWNHLLDKVFPGDQVQTKTKKEKQISIWDGMWIYKFGEGMKLKALYTVTLPCAIASIDINIITDVVDMRIPLLLSKDAMKRAKTCLNVENDSVTMLGKEVLLKCTLYGH